MSILRKYGNIPSGIIAEGQKHPNDCGESCCIKPAGGSYFERVAARKKLLEQKKRQESPPKGLTKLHGGLDLPLPIKDNDNLFKED
eukprot:CAMPEP_0184492662 /NCGR_PEP_ID=MMETSP0113_2-20130426/23940_1 /TAXON_ID=91329 /ORGANISM="Norrisiella sphaerica, Strain BC52" /LENGTH=85 /DNA_ID=CAMNT_0026877595 /DNA_START=17 /DNA_END=271 /DNA_ORIENTATION=+